MMYTKENCKESWLFNSMPEQFSLNDFLSCDDSQLLQCAQSGNENALAVLISRYMGLVKKKAQAYSISAYEQEDVIQEGLIGLMNAITFYDADSDYSFNTFANTCIDNRIRKALQYTNTNKFKSLDRAVSIDHLDYDEVYDAQSATPEDIVIAREKLNAVKAGVDTLLSDLEKEVLFLYLDGNDYKQISQKLGTTAKAVDNALQRVRRKLKNV